MTIGIAGALPFPFRFAPGATALIVIDMQRDFIEPGGFGAALGNDVTPLQAIVPTTARLLAAARDAGLAVIHTRECHKPDLSDCPPRQALARGAAAAHRRPRADGPRPRSPASRGPRSSPTSPPARRDRDRQARQRAPSTPPALGDHLAQHGITHLILAGVTTEVCVQTTMREANDRGFDCLLV